MLSVLLTPQDQRKLQAARGRVHDRKMRRRLQALLLMCQGLPVKTAARKVGILYRELDRVAQRYLAQRSIAALKDASRPVHKREFVDLPRSRLEALLQLDAREFGQVRRRWTAATLAEYLQEHEGLSITANTVSNHLRSNGFRYCRERDCWELSAAARAQPQVDGPPADWRQRLTNLALPATLTDAGAVPLLPPFRELKVLLMLAAAGGRESRARLKAHLPRSTANETLRKLQARADLRAVDTRAARGSDLRLTAHGARLVRRLQPWRARLYRGSRLASCCAPRTLILLFAFEACAGGFYPQQIAAVFGKTLRLGDVSTRCQQLARHGYLKAQRRGGTRAPYAKRKFYALTPNGTALLQLLHALLKLAQTRHH